MLASCLFASHLRAKGDATTHQLVKLSLFICRALCVRLSSGFKLTIKGQSGMGVMEELVHSESASGNTHPAGSDNMDAFVTFFSVGHFSAT